GVPHLLERGIDDLEVAGRSVVAHQAHDGRKDLTEIALLLLLPERADFGEDLRNQLLNLGRGGGGELHDWMIAEPALAEPLGKLGRAGARVLQGMTGAITAAS